MNWLDLKRLHPSIGSALFFNCSSRYHIFPFTITYMETDRHTKKHKERYIKNIETFIFIVVYMVFPLSPVSSLYFSLTLLSPVPLYLSPFPSLPISLSLYIYSIFICFFFVFLTTYVHMKLLRYFRTSKKSSKVRFSLL